MKLSHYAQGRDNNFNLIRLLAAFAVLVSHSFTLSTGDASREPFQATLGMNLGNMAVDIFFVASGFLVTGSLLARRSLLEFAWARILRVYPALIVMVLASVMLLGAALTALPLAEYFGQSQTYVYLARCMTLLRGVSYVLPGVFDGNPYPRVVNGSLWTMPIEVRMYFYLGIGWAVLALAKARRPALFQTAVILCCVVGYAVLLREHFTLPVEHKSTRLFTMFFSGAAYFTLKDRIALRHDLFVIALVATLLATLDRHVFFVVYFLTLPYLLLHIAYRPSGAIRRVNSVGDYSYGIYIYAFPLQQMIVALTPGISAGALIASAGLATLACAMLSWHLLERRMLGLKERAAIATRQLLRLNPRPDSEAA